MQVHNDARFRALSPPAPSAQFLWLRLLTSPESVAAPGLIPATRAGLAEKLGWKTRDFDRCFDELTVETDEHEYPLAIADWSAGLIFLPKAVEYNPPVSPNAVKAWVASLLRVPECDLRDRVIKRLEQFLVPYSEQFRDPFAEQFRYPGAGTGTGTGYQPKALLSAPPDSGAAALDAPPPAPAGGGTGAASAQPSTTANDGGQGGESGETKVVDEFDLDLDEDLGEGSEQASPTKPAVGDDGDGWQLTSPTVPMAGKKGIGGGCTICAASVKGSRAKPRSPGVLFRKIGEQWFAAMCWACIKIGTRNEYSLPTPPEGHQSIAHWKCFEHAMPEQVRAPKKKRDQVIADAIARTRARMDNSAKNAARVAQQAADDARASEPNCDGCGDKPRKPGLVYREASKGGAWIVALCPKCGGSPLHKNPPAFMGPPLPTATNGTWVTLAESAAPKDEEPRFKWIQSAITATRQRLKSGAGVPGTDKPPGESEPVVLNDQQAAEFEASGQADEPQGGPVEVPPEDKGTVPEDVTPPETGLEAPAAAGDDEFSLDDDIPL